MNTSANAYATAIAMNGASNPQNPIIKPAADAPKIRMAVMLPVLNAIAFTIRCLGTMLGIIARRAG